MNHTPQPLIVVGVDCDDRSLAAVDVAAAEATRQRGRLLLLSAYPASGTQGPHHSLTAVLRRVCATWPGLPATARNVTAEPSEAILAAARGAALVVVGRRAHRPTTASVSTQVAAHAECPTIVVPAGVTPTGDAPVLLGLGMTPDDEAAIAVAFEQASQRGVPLLAMHVWRGIPAAPLGPISPFAYDLRKAGSATDRTIAESLAGWSEKYPDVAVERAPLYDVNPARTLVGASAMASLVVVSARRNSHRSSHLLGSVTRTLLQDAACPVMVVHR